MCVEHFVRIYLSLYLFACLEDIPMRLTNNVSLQLVGRACLWCRIREDKTIWFRTLLFWLEYMAEEKRGYENHRIDTNNENRVVCEHILRLYSNYRLCNYMEIAIVRGKLQLTMSNGRKGNRFGL